MDNIHSFGYVDDMLEETVRFLQNRNVSVVLYNERDFNVLCVRGENEKLTVKRKKNYSIKGIKKYTSGMILFKFFVKMGMVLLICNITNFQTKLCILKKQ
ncbi:hypothetical protein CsSME_00030193 [Camellia sinensis var. sinensis]